MLTCLGNKRKLVTKIVEIVTEIKEDMGRDRLVVLDGFSGSCVVSRALCHLSTKIHVNDLEYYAYLMAKCYMIKPTDRDISKIEEHIHAMNSIDEREM